MSFPRYPRYKDSGVEWLGQVPEHWRIVPLKHVADFVNGAAFKPTEWAESGVPIIRIENLNGGDQFNYFQGELPERYIVRTGDLLFGWSGNRGTSFGPFLWTAEGKFALNQHIFRVVSHFLKPEPLYWMLKAVTAWVESQAHGIIGMVHITKGNLGAIPVAIPPDEERHRITTFLNSESAKIDALILEQRRLIELLKEKRQAVISHAVTRGLDPDAPIKPSGVEWLGDVPAHWDVMPVRRIAASVQTGRTPPASSASSDSDSGLNWYTPGDFADTLRLGTSVRRIGRESVASGDISLYPPRSVLVVSIGATLGKVGFTDDECSSNQQINAVIPSERVDGYFLAYSLSAKSDVMRYLSNASTIGIMNQEKTKEIPLAIPPMCEQLCISTFLDNKLVELSTLLGESERAITLLQERRTALISAAVTGKIDVRGVAMAEAA